MTTAATATSRREVVREGERLTSQCAFPSLHAGWNLVVGVVLLGTSTPLAVRAFAVVYPLAMAWAVVASANDFVVDVVAGVVVVVAGLGVAQVVAGRVREDVPTAAPALVL